MIQEASQVVSIVVDIATNTSFVYGNHSCHKVLQDAMACQNEKSAMPIHRSSSFLSMPPPLPKNCCNTSDNYSSKSCDTIENQQKSDVKQPAFQLGLDLLSEAASEQIRVVSPDMSGVASTKRNFIPTLELDDDEDNDVNDVSDEDVSYLSPDQCADIIDTCFLSMNDSIPFLLEPLSKRVRLY
jgi:hypothetical protein